MYLQINFILLHHTYVHLDSILIIVQFPLPFLTPQPPAVLSITPGTCFCRKHICSISLLSTCSTASTAKHYIWFKLAVCRVECPVSNFQGSVQREWCTRLSSHCAHHITTVSQHLNTAAKYSVQHCSGSHTHCATAEGQQLSDQRIHYTTL